MPNCLVIAFDGHITTDKSRQTTCDGIRVMEGEADYYITKLRGSWVSPVSARVPAEVQGQGRLKLMAHVDNIEIW